MKKKTQNEYLQCAEWKSLQVKCIHPMLKTKELEILQQVIPRGPGIVPYGMPQVK